MGPGSLPPGPTPPGTIRRRLPDSHERHDTLRPRALFPGARVALVAPGGALPPGRLEASRQCCRRLGLEPVVASPRGKRRGFLAAPDDERLAEVQCALDDPEIDAIWALRGGYGAIRIVDRLDLGRQRSDPVPFIGFSDNTVLHVAHGEAGVASFHGPHPSGDFPPATEEMFRRVLFSPDPAGALRGEGPEPAGRPLFGGQAHGPLWGGNLATLASLCGSSCALVASGRILCLEDVGEPAYRVDRMWAQLERAGVFRGVKGLALGGFTQLPEGEGDAVHAVLRERALRLRVPAVSNLPFGHRAHNATLPLGIRARLDGDEGKLEILEGAVVPASRRAHAR